MNSIAEVKEKKIWVEGSFRDVPSTVSREGSRLWLFPKKPAGTWFRRRQAFGYALMAFLVCAPFLKMSGHQLVLLDVLHRKFVFFGNVFWPQDFFIFLVAILTVIVSIFLFTAVFGRVWCGWTCPQTIFMELIFRRIEYLIEGDAPAQRKLAKSPWTSEKVQKLTLKYGAFFAASFLIANVFLAYFTGSDTLLRIITEPIGQHWKGFAGLFLFSGVFFFVYAYLREQVCTVICPYGRLQSVLVDDKSLVVAYDYKRGEDREKWGRRRSETAGDCIDCRQCVEVCPTGIDIRNGIQLECINCTACIDACNSVMRKIDKPIDLIGFNSLQGIERKEKFRFDIRRILYLCLLGVMLIGLSVMLALRSDVQATVSRQPGLTFVESQTGVIQNVYQIKVRNKTFTTLPVTLRVENIPAARITMIGQSLTASAESEAEGLFSIEILKGSLLSRNTQLQVGVFAGEKRIQTLKTNFMGPDTR